MTSSTITFTRSRNISSSVDVSFTLTSTTLVYGTHYALSSTSDFTFSGSSGSITMPPSAASVTLTLTTLPALNFLVNNTLVIAITGDSGALYERGTPSEISLKISDINSITFTYASLGDTNDLFYYLGTNELTTSFANPATSGKIVSLSKSILSNNASYSDTKIYDRTSAYYHSDNTPPVWFMFQLAAGQKFYLSDFYIKNRSDSAFQTPYNWRLQGNNTLTTLNVSSVENATWADIFTNIGAPLIPNTANHEQRIILPSPDIVGYRNFRWLQVGTNYSGQNYTALTELMFYGILTTNEDTSVPIFTIGASPTSILEETPAPIFTVSASPSNILEEAPPVFTISASPISIVEETPLPLFTISTAANNITEESPNPVFTISVSTASILEETPAPIFTIGASPSSILEESLTPAFTITASPTSILEETQIPIFTITASQANIAEEDPLPSIAIASTPISILEDTSTNVFAATSTNGTTSNVISWSTTDNNIAPNMVGAWNASENRVLQN
jgi:hypothetical protein